MNCRRSWVATLRPDCKGQDMARVLRLLLRLAAFGLAMMIGLVLALCQLALGAGAAAIVLTIATAGALGLAVARQAVG